VPTKRVVKRNPTSPRVATIASHILRDGRFSEASKSVAGSALSQTKKRKKK